MNENTLNQPVTAGDLNALSVALNAPAVTTARAQQTYLKMIVQMMAAPPGVAPTPNQIFEALAQGAQSKADAALYEALAFETMIGGSVTALIVQAAGFIQIFAWVENAAVWFKTNATSIFTLIKDLGTADFSGAWNQALSLLGISATQAAKDVRYDTAASSKQGLMLLMASEAPILATATTFLSTQGSVNLGTTSGSSSGSVGTSGSIAGIGSTSVGSGSASAPAKTGDRKKNKKKSDGMGWSPRMNLVRRGA